MSIGSPKDSPEGRREAVPLISARRGVSRNLRATMRAIDMHVHLPTGDWVCGCVGHYADSIERYFGTRPETTSIEDFIALYERLLAHVEGQNVSLEEYARQMIRAEELHVGEIDKMLRKRGDA